MIFGNGLLTRTDSCLIPELWRHAGTPMPCKGQRRHRKMHGRLCSHSTWHDGRGTTEPKDVVVALAGGLPQRGTAHTLTWPASVVKPVARAGTRARLHGRPVRSSRPGEKAVPSTHSCCERGRRFPSGTKLACCLRLARTGGRRCHLWRSPISATFVSLRPSHRHAKEEYRPSIHSYAGSR